VGARTKDFLFCILLTYGFSIKERLHDLSTLQECFHFYLWGTCWSHWNDRLCMKKRSLVAKTVNLVKKALLATMEALL